MTIKGLPVSCSESIGDISNIDIEYYSIKATAKKYLFKDFSVDIPYDSEHDLNPCNAVYKGNSRIDGTPMFDIDTDYLGPYIFNGGILKFVYRQDNTEFTLLLKNLQYVLPILYNTVKYCNEKYTRFEI